MRPMQQLEAAVGGLSDPSKMPGYGYGLPASECKLGALLAKVKGSTCSDCYALKGRYVQPTVQAAQRRRLEILQRDPSAWGLAMIDLLAAKLEKMPESRCYFRWHDTGDLQSPEHFEQIVRIAEALPRINFWIPTREKKMVQEVLRRRRNKLPANLVVRMSAAMVGKSAGRLPKGTVASTVGARTCYQCPSRQQGNVCGDCRACWSPSVKSVNYELH